MKYKLKEIKYFRTDGRNVKPNGVSYFNGMTYRDMKKNENSFEHSEVFESFLTEKVAQNQYGLSKYNGGMIVFAVSVNATVENNIKGKLLGLYKTIKNILTKDRMLDRLIKIWNKKFGNIEDQYIGAYSVGKYFKGKYIADNGEVFDDKSTTIEFNGMPSEMLYLFAIGLCKEFRQETVLVKDFNKNKIYMVDSDDIYGDDLNNAKDDLNNYFNNKEENKNDE